MKKIVITSGRAYTDIDTLACSLAYGELLTKQGLANEVILEGPLNESVIPVIKSWPFSFSHKFSYEPANFIIVDISDPSYLPNWIDKTKIIGLYDHHFGFEKYWQEKLGNKAKIEAVGACATLIWEEVVGKKITPSILIANLLFTAIFANTLNFKASITHQRDKNASDLIKKFTQLPDSWIEIYYSELTKNILANPYQAIIKDTKLVDLAGYKITIGQLELWSGQEFIKRYQKEIILALQSFGNATWFLTLPSISEGKNYLYTQSTKAKKLLDQLLRVNFIGDLATTDKLYLRKELLKKLQELPDGR